MDIANIADGDIEFFANNTLIAAIKAATSGQRNFTVGNAVALSTAANRANITINGNSNSILAFGTSNVLRGYLYNNGTSFFMNSGAGDFTIENNNATALVVNQNGYVGVRTQPLYQFSVNGSNNGIDFETNNNSTFATSIFYTIRETGVSRTITTGGYSYGSSNPLTMILTQNSNTPLGMFYAADNADGAGLKGFKSRGTVAAPITVNNGDTIFSMEGWAFHGSGPNHSKFGAGMRFVKDDDFGTANTYAPQRTEFYNANSTTTLQTTFVIIPNGNASLTGTLTQSASDIRLKTNITKIENALDKINQLEGFTYNWNTISPLYNSNITNKEVGVSAQAVREVLPEIVSLAPFDVDNLDGKTSKSGENYLTVQYEKLVPLLIEGIKELKAEFDAYKATHP
jgi:hypothetical protein